VIFLRHFLGGCDWYLLHPSERPVAHLTFDATIVELHNLREAHGVISWQRGDGQ